MLIHIYDGFCHLYDLRFQKSFGENFSFQVQGYFKVIQGQMTIILLNSCLLASFKE